ncbi:PREDICTED: hemocyte protein-glutamine gamma-glutamyltransferase-like [Nicrophorus vespilloides]|uniref:Hemocyte protein-glutamine gamma-glutamyltransferase-like n=1 Tax=Nicrophorus vespilloides TaxID=110193 RepID=A0ABM1NDI9_NICVS|nr:PREDICTED: hemocyte protein-glutamine gamma-glutamyltransferase-like [Nicrophorus vespilloides]
MKHNLKVDLVCLFPKENSTSHKTDKFDLVRDEENPIAVLRRGLKFTIAIRFSERNYEDERDIVKLIFSFGPNPNAIKGTKVTIRLDPKSTDFEHHNNWYAGFLERSGDLFTLEVSASVHCPVGNWFLQVETSRVYSTLPPSTFDYESEIYILFNPWNQHDLVYMPQGELLDEYVLSDVGKIWIGPWGSCRGREWVFGQFYGCVLPAIMLMFNSSELPTASRGDPIKVTRCISKMVNSNDDNGILVGRWDGDYDGGTAPSSWTGSVEILQKYLDKHRSVNYGQCWVFSGVVTTICRALGIPSRVISNLVSAHDANATLSVDKYYDLSNEELNFDPLNPTGEDSVWNYHVWSDVWMARPDLPIGYGGWQAIDATPQEISSGFYQCGPASLEAIKKGQVGFNYDIGFMIASVNADLMRWKIDPMSDLGFTQIHCNKYHIGRMILTKQPHIFDANGDKDRQEITNQYKAKEGTPAERYFLNKAVRCSRFANNVHSLSHSNSEDVEFELQELEKINIGESFALILNIKNVSDQVRTVKTLMSAGSIFYTGVRAHVIKKSEGEFRIKPKSTEVLRMVVTSEEYLDKLVEYCILKLYAVATIVETGQVWADEDDFQVQKPKININLPDGVQINAATKITMSFRNPLQQVLTKCKFNLSGPTLLRNQILHYRNVKPGVMVKIAINIIPLVPGEQKIVATFSSKELLDITGSAKVKVFDENY